MGESLVTLIRRVRGPINLLEGAAVVEVEKTNIEGRDVLRLEVRDDPAGAEAYYIDAVTRLPRYITTAGPNGRGTVTVLQYRLLEGGLPFPERVRLLRKGQNTLLGDVLLMEAEFMEVRP